MQVPLLFHGTVVVRKEPAIGEGPTMPLTPDLRRGIDRIRDNQDRMS